MNQGGISRAAVFRLIDAAQGRTSSNFVSGIGATPLGRWQFSHDRCRMGAMSLVNVIARVGACPQNDGQDQRPAAINATKTIEPTPIALRLDDRFIPMRATHARADSTLSVIELSTNFAQAASMHH